MSYALKLGGAAIIILLLGVLGIVLFAWNVDRKDKAKRARLDELPDV
jgi:hypothetical protein